MCIPLLAKKPQLLWMAVETDTKEKKLLNKVVIFVFFAHKKYSRSFIKLRLYHWCHTDYFNDVLTTFLGLELGWSIAVCERSERSRISFKISYRYFVFRRWMKFLRVWNDKRVSNFQKLDRNFHFWVNYPFKSVQRKAMGSKIISNGI